MKVVPTIYTLSVMWMVKAAPFSEDESEKSALPINENFEDPLDKRLNYGNPYVSPCAAASSPVPSIAPAVAYQPYLTPAQQYMRPYTYGYNYNHPRYRSADETENELLSFSDMDRVTSNNVPVGVEGINMPFNYPGDPRMAALNSQYSPVQTLPSFGAFPYTNPAALSVPFLFSCSPSIVQGQMVRSQPHYYTGYRATDVYGNIVLQSLLEAQSNIQTQPEQSPAPQKPKNIVTKPQ